MDHFLLDYQGKWIVVFILVGILILAVPFHLLEILDDLIQVSSSDLVKVSGVTLLSSKENERVFTCIV